MDSAVPTEEQIILLDGDDVPESYRVSELIESNGGQVVHRYGSRVLIGSVPAEVERGLTSRRGVRSVRAESIGRRVPRLSEAESLGVAAWNLRRSVTYAEAKAARPLDGERWDPGDVGGPLPPDGPGMVHVDEPEPQGAAFWGTEDMSPYLIGSVAVGLVIVSGKRADLAFSDEEKAKVVAEVQAGLGWLATQEPKASVTFAYDIKTVELDIEPDPALTGYDPLELHWRDPAMQQLGFQTGLGGVRDYVAGIRKSLGTRWGYAGFFTKYPVQHFAYALKPKIVLQYQNDGWGPDNIDRVFTHETGHIFGCPDEYASSGCSCSTKCGYLREPNGNCQSCASPFVDCLMAANTFAMCAHTPVQLGWRDSDADGSLDPVDPVNAPPIDLGALCSRVPVLCQVLGLGPAAAQAGVAAGRTTVPPPSHESIPLFLLRRVLSDDEMSRVQDALDREEAEYLDALERKLRTAADSIGAEHRRLTLRAGSTATEPSAAGAARPATGRGPR